MLSPSQRTTILELNTQGVSKRQIARVLGLSRLAVRKRSALEFPPGAGTPPPRESRTLPAADPGVVRHVARGIWCESMKSSSPAVPSSLTKP